MTRAEAQQIIAPYIVRVGVYNVVAISAARDILGTDFDRMLSDPIRGVSVGNYVYPWNVIDFMTTLAAEPILFNDMGAGI
jgi:hypothetical protein